MASSVMIHLPYVLLLSLMCFPLNLVSAIQYTVGGSSGWNLGVDYGTWAAQYSFKIGDTLEFNYDGVHSVSEVSEADYKSCSSANAITTSSTGKTTIKLSKAQTYYFVCGVQSHCETGMKLSVDVSSSSSASSSTTPSSTSSTSPSTSSSTSPSTSSPTGTSEAMASGASSCFPSSLLSMMIVAFIALVTILH